MDHALWIGPSEGHVPPPGARPAHWLRHVFDLSLTGSAAIRVAARGLVDVFVNGRRVGDELLPGYTQYDRRLPVRTIDVTDSVVVGRAVMAEFGQLLSRPQTEIEQYLDLARGARNEWQREFITDDGTLRVQSQASHVRALASGLVDDDLRAPVAHRLAQLIREAGTTVGTGFLSTGMLLSTLAKHGHLDLAYGLLLQPKAPGWMCMLERGATTVWEEWEGVDANGTPHASLNHYSKGAVISFLHRHVAGLTPTSPGYRTFEVRPQPGGGLNRASQQLDTRHGTIGINWRINDVTFELDDDVPPSTRADVVLPNDEKHGVGSGCHRFTAPR